MKKSSLLTVLFIGAGFIIRAQTKIKDGTVSGSSNIPASNAILELESNNKGFLPPRVTLANDTDITTVPNPTEGMIIYNLSSGADSGNLTPGLYCFTPGVWKKLGFAPSATTNPNVTVMNNGYIGVYTGQSTNGVTFGNISVRLHRRSDATNYTNDNDQIDVQVRNNLTDTVTINGFAETIYNDNFYNNSGTGSSSNLFAATSNPQSGDRSNSTLAPNIWYGCGEIGFFTDGHIEKRQYVLTPSGLTENYFYRLEFMFVDDTWDCSTCDQANPSENNGKVIIYGEFVHAN